MFRRIEDITYLQAQNKSLLISYDHSSVRHCMVRGDEMRIEQILINIVSNAIKYTPNGKSVTLIAEEEPSEDPGKNRTGSSLPGDYCRNLPIIAMSANAYEEDVKACLDIGMNAHIAKPFQPEQLYKLLEQLV